MTLPSLFVGTFGASIAPLRDFLDEYGWHMTPHLPHRGMSMMLLHEFGRLRGYTSDRWTTCEP